MLREMSNALFSNAVERDRIAGVPLDRTRA
jgi:hypothetical protein